MAQMQGWFMPLCHLDKADAAILWICTLIFAAANDSGLNGYRRSGQMFIQGKNSQKCW
jgi:hypothetical protein